MSHFLRVNGNAQQTIDFNVAELFGFEARRYKMVSVPVPLEWLVVGENQFFISEHGLPMGWLYNNLRVGVDTGSDADRSWWNGNGLTCGSVANCMGELMIHLALTTRSEACIETASPCDDCNENGNPDSCDLAYGIGVDCDANGVLDVCDIASGNSSDCDGNGVPDECELAVFSREDCNGDGVPNFCEILKGDAVDENCTGIPDACECDGEKPTFLRGDANCSGALEMEDADLIFNISLGFAEACCEDAADANDDGMIDNADAVAVVHQIQGSASLPGPCVCGPDPTADDPLGCAESYCKAAPCADEGSRFLRGDCDGDGNACSGVSDALALLNWLFLGAGSPPCVAACDPNANGRADVSDAVYGLNYCFQGGAAPVAPFPECGVASEADLALGCEVTPVACE